MSRIEKILRAMIDGTSYGEEPQSRIEAILLAIKNNTQYSDLPHGRIEEILLAIKNGTSYSKEPMSRIEEILLTKLNGVEYAKLPQSRIEELLIEWIKQEIEFEGVPPLTYKAVEGALNNYRIYGNTVDGESVGDRTANLFNGELQNGYWNTLETLAQTSSAAFRSFKIFLPAGTYTITFATNVNIVRLIADGAITQNIGNNLTEYTFTTQTNDDVGFSFRITGTSPVPWDNSDIMLNIGSVAIPYEPYGYRVPVTIEGKNLFNNIWEQGNIRADNGQKEASNTMICSDYFPVEYDKTYSISRTISEGYNNVRGYDASKNYIGGGTTVCSVNNPFVNADAKKGIFKITNSLVAFIKFNHYSNNLNMKYMIVEGDYTNTPIPPYEPYLEPTTTNLYLPEQIKMVGNEVEYMDFKEQKQYFVDGTTADVTLPALPTLSGTNTLSVGTTVQPSKVYLKYKGG